MSEENVCQSCCVVLDQDELAGTEANGEKSQDYCIYCYKEGKFTQPDATLDVMINISAEVWADKDPNVTIEQAKAQLRKKLPFLKRWCR